MSLLCAAERASAALARWRRARALHPAGRTFAGEVTVEGADPATGVGLLDHPGRYPATVRFSRGVPTPSGWPDVLGLAIRVHIDARRPFDLLASSSGRAPLLRQLPLPRRRFTGTYSTIMSYRSAHGRLWLAALPSPMSLTLGYDLDGLVAAARQGTPRLVLAVASAVGPWRPFGTVHVGAALSPATDAALAFDPIGNLPDGLWAAGPLARLRERTYRGSRHARGASVQSGGSTATTV